MRPLAPVVKAVAPLPRHDTSGQHARPAPTQLPEVHKVAKLVRSIENTKRNDVSHAAATIFHRPRARSYLLEKFPEC
jgi:hypothetical protein